MFIPKPFQQKNTEELYSFIQSYSFGQLVTIQNNLPVVTPIPILLSDDKSRLLGHLARGNPQHEQLDGQNVLMTLMGEHGYVSPSWYTVPGGVPTWNYQSVQITGKINLIEQSEQKQQIVEQLSRANEISFDHPWEPNYELGMLAGIVAFEIIIDEIEGKYKLSQNKSEEDQLSVIEHLKQHGKNGLAKEMTRVKNLPT